jgi:hypothetical protein
MTFDRISAHLAEAVRTLDYSLTQLDGDPDTIADIEDVIAGLRELRLEIEVQTCRPPPACRQPNLAYGLTSHRPLSPAAAGNESTNTRVVWIHQIAERDPNPLVIPLRPSLEPEAAIRFDLHLMLDKATPVTLKTADPVQIACWSQSTLAGISGRNNRNDTYIYSCRDSHAAKARSCESAATFLPLGPASSGVSRKVQAYIYNFFCRRKI